jgi:hypothetical protein
MTTPCGDPANYASHGQCGDYADELVDAGWTPPEHPAPARHRRTKGPRTMTSTLRRALALLALLTLTIGAGLTPAHAAPKHLSRYAIEYGHSVNVVVDGACDWTLQVKWSTNSGRTEPVGYRAHQNGTVCVYKKSGSSAFNFINSRTGIVVGSDSTNCDLPRSGTAWSECTFSGLGTPTVALADSPRVTIDFYLSDNRTGGHNGIHQVSGYYYR